jgi:hypothetical protein
MRITNTGGIGIGTTAVGDFGSTTVTIDAFRSGGALYRARGTNVDAIMQASDVNSAMLLGTRGAHSLNIQTNNLERMRITSGGNVGIGTTSPASKLDVLGFSYTGSDTNNAFFINSDASLVTIGAAGRTTYSTSDLRFITSDGTAALERMRITSAGNVGIGTTNPLRKLTVQGDSTATLTVAAFYNADLTNNNGSVFSFRTDTSGAGAQTFWEYAGVSGVVNEHNNATRAGSLNFFTANSTSAATRLTVAANGNVGIGTTTPGYRLQVTGDGLFSGQVLLGTTIVTGAGVSTEDTAIELGGARTGDGNSYIDLHSASGTDFESRIIRGPGTNGVFEIVNTGTGSFTLRTAGSAPLVMSTASTERMRITSAGNVGIGTASPSNPLDVVGTARAGNFRVNAGGSVSGAGMWGVDTDLAFNTNSLERVRIDTSGNVGIGTTVPSLKFVVSNAGAQGLEIDPTALASSPIIQAYNRSGAAYIQMGFNALQYIWQTSGTERMRFTSDGNLLVGRSSAFAQAYRVVVEGNSETIAVPMAINDARAGTADSRILAFLRGGTETGYITSTNALMSIAGNSGLAFQTAGFEHIRITNTGNVGIGATSPLAKLVVSNGSNENLEFTGGSSTVNGGVIEYINRTSGDTRPDLNYYLGTGGAHKFYTSGTERLRITSGGNVGIGATSPAVKFVVSNANAEGYEINPTGGVGGGATIATYNRTTSAYTTLSTYSSAMTWFVGSSGATRAMDIIASGNVGIGVSSPAERLTVAGNFRVTWASEPAVYNITIAGRSPGSGIVDWDFSTNDATFGSRTPMTIKSNGNIGIGTQTPGYALEVSGSFAATTKSFVINHPTKPDMKLRYGSLEGPENGVYVRGRLKDSNVIELPDYWTALVDEDSITVNLTPIGKSQKLFVEDIKDNCVYVGNGNLMRKGINCFYTVYAERKDVEKLEVEIAK